MVYQQNNCALNRAKSVIASMDSNRMNVMKWPSQSPDSNPIENAWFFLKKKLRARPMYPTSTTDLFKILQNE